MKNIVNYTSKKIAGIGNDFNLDIKNVLPPTTQNPDFKIGNVDCYDMDNIYNNAYGTIYRTLCVYKGFAWIVNIYS